MQRLNVNQIGTYKGMPVYEADVPAGGFVIAKCVDKGLSGERYESAVFHPHRNIARKTVYDYELTREAPAVTAPASRPRQTYKPKQPEEGQAGGDQSRSHEGFSRMAKPKDPG